MNICTLAYIFISVFTASSVFAGPMIGGGPPNVKEMISCNRGDGVTLHVYAPGAAAFYATNSVLANLSCNQMTPLLCEGTGDDGIGYKIKIAKYKGRLQANVFTESNEPVEVLDCQSRN